MARDNITPTIEQAMTQEEISTRMMLEVYLSQSLLPTSIPQFSEATFIHVENGYYVIKFIADNADLTLGTKVYQSAEIIRGSLESSQDGKLETLNIQLSNRSQLWAATLVQVGRYMNNMPCKLLEYFPDYPDEPPAYYFSGKINNMKMSISQFVFDVQRVLGDYESDAPYWTFDPNCQYKFKKDRCRYSGPATRCDKTINTCESFGNILRFGGHPSIPKEMTS
jgi:hypothetical protein